MTGVLEQRLMGDHPRIEELFRSHRFALLDRDLELARERFETFRETLLAHLEFEEREILPLYEQHAAADTNSPPEQFRKEHTKLRELCRKIGARLESIGDGHAQVLDLLDTEVFLRSLLEHHDLREGSILYPRLGEVLADEEQGRLVALHDRQPNQ